MTQSLTDMITSSLTSEDEKDSELLWRRHVFHLDCGGDMCFIRDLREDPSKDCVIIVDETRIPVHKTVVELNSAMLSSRSVRFDEHNEITEIEVELEFDDHPNMVKDIVTSFYSGKIVCNEEVMKEMYKFSAFYEIRWLRIHISRLIVNYLTKSMFGCYERFKEILSMAHFIWDNDLFEICILVIDEEILEFLIKDEEMLQGISYRCMEIITMSSNVGIPEKDLFDLLVAWTRCKKQEHNKVIQQLFKNLRYNSMNEHFIIDRVMSYVYQNGDIFTVSMVKNIQDGMSKDMCSISSEDSELEDTYVIVKIPMSKPEDMCRSRSEPKKIAFAGQMVIRNLKSPDKTQKEKVNEVNTFLIRKDIRYVPEKMKEKLAHKICRNRDTILSSLDWLSIVNLTNHHPTKRTACMLLDYTDYKHDISLSEFYKLDWTKVTDKAIRCVDVGEYGTFGNFYHYRVHWEYNLHTRGVMSWCLANRGTTDHVTLEGVLSTGLCYKVHGDVYNSNILLPTIKYLLPNSNTKKKLKCQHHGGCDRYSALGWKRKTVNKNLYKLKPFADDVAILTDNNGVLELSFRSYYGHRIIYGGIMFIKDTPYEPFYPVHCKTVDDETLRRFIATLNENDKIVIFLLINETRQVEFDWPLIEIIDRDYISE